MVFQMHAYSHSHEGGLYTCGAHSNMSVRIHAFETPYITSIDTHMYVHSDTSGSFGLKILTHVPQRHRWKFWIEDSYICRQEVSCMHAYILLIKPLHTFAACHHNSLSRQPQLTYTSPYVQYQQTCKPTISMANGNHPCTLISDPNLMIDRILLPKQFFFPMNQCMKRLVCNPPIALFSIYPTSHAPLHESSHSAAICMSTQLAFNSWYQPS